VLDLRNVSRQSTVRGRPTRRVFVGLPQTGVGWEQLQTAVVCTAKLPLHADCELQSQDGAIRHTIEEASSKARDPVSC
jgi:hypothetical protein